MAAWIYFGNITDLPTRASCWSTFAYITVLECKTPPPLCIRDFCLTMTSMLQLNEDPWNSGMRYLALRRLSRDALENILCIIRRNCVSSADFSCIQSHPAIMHLLLEQLFRTTPGSNCVEDVGSVVAAVPIGHNYMNTQEHLLLPCTSLIMSSWHPVGRHCRKGLTVQHSSQGGLGQNFSVVTHAPLSWNAACWSTVPHFRTAANCCFIWVSKMWTVMTLESCRFLFLPLRHLWVRARKPSKLASEKPASCEKSGTSSAHHSDDMTRGHCGKKVS